MQQFKLRKDGFAEIKKQMLARAIPTMVIAIAGGLAIGLINSGPAESMAITLPIILVFIAGITTFSISNAIKRQKKLLESYTLTLTDNSITREQLDTPAISIDFNEISEISKEGNGNLRIRGKNKADLIIVHSQIENYSMLEEALTRFQPITAKPGDPFIRAIRPFLSLVTVGLMVWFYISDNKVIVAVTGTLLSLILLSSLFFVLRSKNVDRRTKWSSLIVIIVLASVIGVMIMKLS
jgi:hypothetical protein